MKKVLTLVLALVMALGVTAVAWATGEENGEAKPVEVWTGYTGTKVSDHATIADAVAHLGENKWIVIGKDYTLCENFSIPTGVAVDVAKDATLTVAQGVTLTVAKDAKRLGVRDGGTLVNNGTILVCGTSNAAGKVMVQDGGTLNINTLSVPEGYVLDKSGTNYYAAIPIFEFTYSDGTTTRTAEKSNMTGAVKMKLLDDYSGALTISNVGDNFVLDLGGFTLSGKSTASTQVLNISAPMTIQNGTIKYMSSDTGCGAMITSADVVIAGDVTIDGGKGYGIWTDGYGHTLTVNGTVKSDGDYAITSNGSENGGLIAECNIVVNGGAKIEAKNGIAIYHPEKGTVTVNGGDISGHTGIEMCAGKLVVKGGSITSSGANMDATGSQNAILDGGAISIIDRNYPGGTPTMEITGGTIRATGEGALAVKAYDYKSDMVKEWTNAAESVKVSGGTFSNNPNTYVVQNTPVATAGSDYIVGGKDIADAANGGKDVTVIEGGAINGVKEGVTIAIGEDAGTVIINNKTVKGDSYTVPITPRYYYNSTTTDTKKDDGKSSPKTFDVGVGAYAVSAVLSLTGMAYVGKKKF